MGEQSKTAEKWPTEEMVKAGLKRMFGERNYTAPWDDVIALMFTDMEAAAPKAEPAQQATKEDAQNPKFTMAEWTAHARKHRWRFDLDMPNEGAASEQVSAPKHEGMTIAGGGASMLGKLMREQYASRGGVYPDGNPNAALAVQQAPAQPPAKVEREGLTEAEKDELNPYKLSRGAYSIWRSGFDAAERTYCPQNTEAVEKAFGIPATGGEGAK